MREVITLKSGSQFAFGEPSFAEASELMEVLAAEMLKVNVDLGDLSSYLTSEGEVEELLKEPKILNTLKNAVCQMLASKPFKAALTACMRRSLLNSERITAETFSANRGDYLPVCWEVAKSTLLPFVSGLSVSFSKSPNLPKSSPQ